MFSRFKFFCRIRCSENITSLLKKSTDATSKPTYSQLFFDDTVQSLLKKINKIDYKTVFKVHNFGEQYSDIKYELMTDKQLEQAKKKANEKAHAFLQIPPLVDPDPDKTEILDVSPGVDGFDIHHSKLIFTDTSDQVINEKRIIVVREPNGVLRTASKEERKRMNQIYFPINGRELTMPKMFEDENLKKVLQRNDYKFILDRACVQFDPDDPIYHKIIGMTYEQINKEIHFEMLNSTRHFGAIVFYLISHKKIDNLLLFLIEADRLDDAYTLIELYHIIHPDCKSAELMCKDENLEKLKQFIELETTERSILLSVLAHCLKKKEEKEKTESEILKAHGYQ